MTIDHAPRRGPLHEGPMTERSELLAIIHFHARVDCFAGEVLQQLPMEFAVEAQKRLGISLEGSVG